MFGTYRTILALMVVVGHLLQVEFLGSLAVMGFFVLSGFLMTAIMHESYGYSASGRGRFVLNRCLRLYPTYWLACAVSLGVIAWCGAEYVKSYRAAIAVPRDTVAILANLTIIFPDFFPFQFTPRLSLPTWALTVELCYYALICLGASKTRKRAVAWLSVSVVYVIATL